ncbi:beta strand repeat-containing protein, partial [Pedobacter nototheniae]|uniref:beta strand repeat-containing protein n=1 Tax=Pedobacter nototheniae TaxID=2488994 RepID=UPI0029303B42
SGTYSVTTRNAAGCTSTATSIVINAQPATPAVPTLGTVVQPTSCTPTGSFTISNYDASNTYTVNPSAGTTINGSTVTAPAGTYTVTATLGSCNSGPSSDVTLTQPATLRATISAQTNVNCFGASTGSAIATATGGVSPYTYSWTTTPVQTDATASNLAAGAYTVTVTDANGCTASQDVTITGPAAAINITGMVSNSTCGATNNGSVDITLSGGSTPYTYAWDSGETTQDISNKGAGTYTVTVTDGKGCTAAFSFTVTAGNCQPVAVADHGQTDPGVAVTGNAATNDTPSGDGGNTWTLIGTNGGATLGTVTMNTDGTYTYIPNANVSGTDIFNYKVCDANGDCATTTVTITIDASTLNITTSTTNVKCFGESGGSATVTATGGTAPYTYSWSNGITDATANNLAKGSYTVTVTDNVGTIRTATVTITEPVSALVAGIDVPPVEVKCFGQNTGSATASAVGGTGAYTYLWSNGTTSATAANLAAGVYTVTVTDANGCSDTEDITITQPAAALSATISTQTDVACFGSDTGSATVSATGGTAPYTYSWNTSPVQTSATASNLIAGSYMVTVTDANNCSTTQSVTITQPAAALSASNSAVNVKCFGDATGAIDVTVSGGTAPYSYVWTGGTTANTEDLSSLNAGTYNLTITDANGCSTTQSVTIIQPAAALSANNTAVNVKCFGEATGAIDVTVSGGIAPYTYAWTGGTTATTEDLSNLAAGTYNLTITDANNCSTTQSVTITQPAAALSASNSAVNVKCFGDATGSIDVTVSGGTVP